MMRTQRPRVLIRTLPLSAGNYGGILQAYALQRALDSLGVDPATDSTKLATSTPSLRARTKRLVKRLAFRLGLLRNARQSWVKEELKSILDAPLLEFVAGRISQVRLYRDTAGNVDSGVLDRFHGFVIGSDQVWRARWSDVGSYLLDFLPLDERRPRVAYAASFGKDDVAEYGDSLRMESVGLAQRLTAVSVRERSGVDICHREWDIEAEQHVDPIFLLSPERYAELAAEVPALAAEGGVVSYVLDESPATARQIGQIAARFNAPVVSLTPEVPATWRASRHAPERYVRPRVEQWLGAIARAQFVVTDSFHGTAFAILNNVPFVGIVNRARGASRFDSLLDTFGLQERLLEPGDEVPDALLTESIDWESVNDRISTERERSYEYLRRVLVSRVMVT